MNLFHSLYNRMSRRASGISQLYMRLKSRVTLYFVLMVMLPSAAAILAIYLHTRSLMVQASYEASLARISREKDYIGHRLGELEQAIDSSVSFISAEHLSRLLDSSSDAGNSGILADMAERYLLPAQRKSLSAIYVTDTGGIRAAYGPDAGHAVISGPSSQKWFADALADRGKVQMLGTVQRFYAAGESRLVFSAAKAAGYGEDARAVILFDFGHSLLTDFLSAPESGPEQDGQSGSSERLILDRDGYILYSREMGQLTVKASEAVLARIGEEPEGFSRIRYDGSDYYMTYVKYPEFGWVFMDLVPVSSAAGRLWLRSPLLIACLVLFGLTYLLYPAVLLRRLKPINDLTSALSDYESHFSGGTGSSPSLQVRGPGPGSGDPAGIDHLINKISGIKLRQKEAELNSLQNQINPHFLYNTLESIRGAALYHGIPEIASMARSMSQLFRYSISERVLVSVKEELQHLENYISIQNFRFEDKFQLQYSIPPEIMDYRILKLTLQPLIENSIKHGLEMKLGKGTIKIEILRLNSNIKIVVSDDGLGMPQKKLEDLNRLLAGVKSRDTGTGTRSGTGIGVMNVNSRIKLYFGDQYGLKFREAAVGTTVEILLPAITETPEG
jgi:signal transduction histidine kinase